MDGRLLEPLDSPGAPPHGPAEAWPLSMMDPATTTDLIALHDQPPPAPALPPGMRCWQLRRRQIHRGVLGLGRDAPLRADALARDVRAAVRRVFRPRWWRGFAFGVLVHASGGLACPRAAFEPLVDAFDNPRGVWQWLIVVDHRTHTALAVHMWAHGWLHASFEDTVARLRAAGVVVAVGYRPRPRFWAWLEQCLSRLTP